ncbi:hypothetical protein F5Y10DRAFT_238122 [Nemania abortiva]|nr:hypothetical protein F5Y10DRAFT_238122 [Nemania abortiva]
MSPTTTPPSSPTLRRVDTGCSATLSASLVPASVTHDAARCKCMKVRTDAEIAQLAENVRSALKEGILESDKPALAFAMILLGAEVVYDQ